jgi:hypothetical protein
MAAMMILVTDKRHTRLILLPRWLLVLGWLAALLMALVVALLLWSSVG